MILQTFKRKGRQGLYWLYKKVYKRPQFYKRVIKALIPRSIKIQFLLLERGKKIWGFGPAQTKEIKEIRVLHVVPLTYGHKSKRFLGSNKDILFKQKIFESKYCSNYFLLRFPSGDKDAEAAVKLEAIKYRLRMLPSNAVIYIDMPGSFPKFILLLRKVCPTQKIVFRAHNAEGLHNLDKFRVSRKLKWLIKSFTARISDKKIMQAIDYVDSISKRDIRGYWSRISCRTEQHKIRYLPFNYHIDDKWTFPGKFKEGEAADIVCIGSPGKLNVLNASAVDELIKNSLVLSSLGSCITCAVTGTLSVVKERKLERIGIKPLGTIDDVSSVLCGATHLVDLSGRGYGFKTKYLEAIAHGCKLIIPLHFKSHMPLELLPFCITLDKKNGLHHFSSCNANQLNQHRQQVFDHYFQLAVNRLMFR